MIGVVTKANKKAPFVMLVDHIPRFKHTEAHFSPNSTDSLCFLVAQVPRPRDMAIFVLTTTTTTMTTTTRPITLPLAHARGVIIIILWNVMVYRKC